MLLRRRPPAARALALFAVSGAGCSSTATPAGLEVVVETDVPASDYGSVWVEVSQQNAGGVFHQLVDEPLKGGLPARFAIAAGTSPDQDVLVTVTMYATSGVSDSGPGTTPLVRRTEQLQVPTTYVATLDVNLSPEQSACPGRYTRGSTATNTPATCFIDLNDAGPLPAYRADATTFDAGRADVALFHDTGRADVALLHDAGPPDVARDARHDATARREAGPQEAGDDAKAQHETGVRDAGRDATMLLGDAGHDSGRDAAHDSGRGDARGADAGSDAHDAESSSPTLTAIAPPQGYRGDSISVALEGSGFSRGPTPTIEVSPADDITVSDVHVVDDSTLGATFTFAPGLTSVAVRVNVETPDGTSDGQRFQVLGSFDVTSPADTLDAGEDDAGGGELRHALELVPSGDRIVIDLAPDAGPIVLSAPLPPITKDLFITGQSSLATRAVIDGSNRYRIFFVESGSVTLENLTLQRGAAIGGAGGSGVWGGGGGGLGAGAGVFIDSAGARVVLDDVWFVVMLAKGGNGGPGFGGMVGASGGGGGGLAFPGGSGIPDASITGGVGGGGGGGVLGPGGDVSGPVGGVGGAGGGGAGSSFADSDAGLPEGGSAYVGDAGGGSGATGAAGSGGFGGGGGGGSPDHDAAGGGFGGGGGGMSVPDSPGGAGGPGGGGGGGQSMGALDGSALGGAGGVLVGTISGGAGGGLINDDIEAYQGVGGGGGAAVGPAVFVRNGTLVCANCVASQLTADGGTGFINGSADDNAIFNYAGMVTLITGDASVTIPDAGGIPLPLVDASVAP